MLDSSYSPDGTSTSSVPHAYCLVIERVARPQRPRPPPALTIHLRHPERSEGSLFPCLRSDHLQVVIFACRVVRRLHPDAFYRGDHRNLSRPRREAVIFASFRHLRLWKSAGLHRSPHTGPDRRAETSALSSSTRSVRSVLQPVGGANAARSWLFRSRQYLRSAPYEQTRSAVPRVTCRSRSALLAISSSRFPPCSHLETFSFGLAR